MGKFVVRGDHITLGQLLHAAGVIGSGGDAKRYLAETPVLVNNEAESRRGRKLRPGDTVVLQDIGTLQVVAEEEAEPDKSR